MTAVPAAADSVTRLGRYRLIERIGGGATSAVYAAHDEAMDRRVAVKLLGAIHDSAPLALERFRQHDPDSEFLFPPPADAVEAPEKPERVELTLFDSLDD